MGIRTECYTYYTPDPRKPQAFFLVRTDGALYNKCQVVIVSVTSFIVKVPLRGRSN